MYVLLKASKFKQVFEKFSKDFLLIKKDLVFKGRVCNIYIFDWCRIG